MTEWLSFWTHSRLLTVVVAQQCFCPVWLRVWPLTAWPLTADFVCPCTKAVKPFGILSDLWLAICCAASCRGSTGGWSGGTRRRRHRPSWRTATGPWARRRTRRTRSCWPRRVSCANTRPGWKLACRSWRTTTSSWNRSCIGSENYCCRYTRTEAFRFGRFALDMTVKRLCVCVCMLCVCVSVCVCVYVVCLC